MKAMISGFSVTNRVTGAAVLMIALAAGYLGWRPAGTYAAADSLLAGKVTSGGKAVADVPIRAHRDNSNITVSVFTNSQGEYSFPAGSDLLPGSYSIAVELAEFEPFKRDAITISSGKTAPLDITLQARQPAVQDATASDIVAALPGTDDQKHLFIQCDNCHSLQWVLRKPHTKEEWVKIVRRMAGEQAANRETPGTRAFGQKQYIEPLADYLASIRGPGSSDQIPFKLRSRPADEASTRLVVTEYDIPRGGVREPYMIRGDRRFAWPHDVLVTQDYVYYTDHFSYNFGKVNKKTGEAKEFPYTVPPGVGRDGMPGDGRAGNPGGGAHDMAFDPEGNIIFGVGGGTGVFNTKTEQIKVWPAGSAQFGMGPDGMVWFLHGTGKLERIDPKTGEVKSFAIGQREGIYDMETDSHGRSILNIYAGGKFGLYDPKTDKYAEYPTLTPGSGPRRGDLDAHDREWVGLYWAGRLGMFDPNKGEVKEFPLVPDSKPYGPPFPSPYTAAADDKNQIVWTTDFNSSRIYRIDMKTGKSTEFFMPAPYEVRDLTVDKTASRPTLWIPAYRPPSKMVKVQVW